MTTENYSDLKNTVECNASLRNAHQHCLHPAIFLNGKKKKDFPFKRLNREVEKILKSKRKRLWVVKRQGHMSQNIFFFDFPPL